MQIAIDLPELNISEQELLVLVASKLFEEEIVSLGGAAEIAGYSVSTFAEMLIKRGVPAIKFDDLSIKEELENA